MYQFVQLCVHNMYLSVQLCVDYMYLSEQLRVHPSAARRPARST